MLRTSWPTELYLCSICKRFQMLRSVASRLLVLQHDGCSMAFAALNTGHLSPVGNPYLQQNATNPCLIDAHMVTDSDARLQQSSAKWRRWCTATSQSRLSLMFWGKAPWCVVATCGGMPALTQRWLHGTANISDVHNVNVPGRCLCLWGLSPR